MPYRTHGWLRAAHEAGPPFASFGGTLVPHDENAVGAMGAARAATVPPVHGAELVDGALLRLPDEPARLSNAELTGKALRERNELCAKSAIGCRSKPDEPHAVELLRAQQARLRTRPHFECCEYP